MDSAARRLEALEPFESRLPLRVPFPDFLRRPIFEGDWIAHPSGEKALVYYNAYEPNEALRWRCEYLDGTLGFLSLQVGPKGQAMVWKARPLYWTGADIEPWLVGYEADAGPESPRG
jgi:hypothetical protein